MITGRDIQVMLAAIADVESWDAQHDSVAHGPEGAWKVERGLPVPSRMLVRRVRQIERDMRGRDGKPKPVTFSPAELEAIVSMEAIAGAGLESEGDYQDWTGLTYSAAARAATKSHVLLSRLERKSVKR